MKPKVIQQVEDAMVDAVMDAAAGLGLTPLQRAKFIVNISEVLIDAVSPFVQHQDAPEPKVVRKRGPRKAKPAAVAAIVKTMLDAGAAAVAPAAAAPPDTTQPAPFRNPQPFAG